jgi:hypothetical protein
MKKPIKVTLIAAASLSAAVLVALILVPILFKDRIVERLRVELNERIDATVTFSDIDVSLLSTFPTLTARVESIAIAGKGEFEGVTLLAADSIGAGVDLVVLIMSGEIEIQSIEVERPEVNVRVSQDGKANYDIIESTSPATDAPADPLALEIERYRISQGTITYEEPGVRIRVLDLEHRGRAEISGSTQQLSSETTVGSVSVTLGRVTYLKEAKASASVDGTVETEESRLTLRSLVLSINQLSLEGSGSVAWPDEGTELDLRLSSKKGLPIKALVSAIPNAYAGDFAGLQASGAFSFEATIKGRLGPDDGDIPSFTAAAIIRDGALKYPDLPLGMTDIQLDAKAVHPGGNLDKMRIDVPKYAIAAGKSHVNGRLNITRPISQPEIDLVLDGRFDLAEIAKAYPIPEVEALEGLVVAKVDLSAKGERIGKLTGEIRVTDLLYRPEKAPAIRIPTAQIELSPESTTIKELRAEVAKSDIAINGLVSPITALLLGDRPTTASLWVQSKQLRVEDFLAPDAPEDSSEPSGFVLPDDVDARLQFDVAELTYGDLVLKNFKGTGRIRDRKLVLSDVRANALGGSMKLDGTFATPVDRPAVFDIHYTIDKIRFADAFEALPSLRAYAPIARFLDGRFSTDFNAKGTLDEELSPNLASIDASGLVSALQSKLSSDFKPLALLNEAIPSIPKPLDLESVRARFQIKDGSLELKPTTVQARGATMQLSGTHGLDQEMKYQVTSDVPIDKLTSSIAKEVKALGIDLSKAKTVGVRAKVNGSIKSPRISVDVDTSSLRGAVADAVSAELAEQKARAFAEAAKQAKRLVDEAEKRADQIRAEATKAAEQIRKEGYARADQLQKEGAGNPLKEIAAKEGAKRIRSETDKRTKQLTAEADKRADQMVAEARKRSDQLVQEAIKGGDQATDSIEKQTDRAR